MNLEDEHGLRGRKFGDHPVLDPSHVESKVKHERNTHRFTVHLLDIQYTNKKQVLYIIHDLSYLVIYTFLPMSHL